MESQTKFDHVMPRLLHTKWRCCNKLPEQFEIQSRPQRLWEGN